MSAATWPTSCLSKPLTVMRVGLGHLELHALGRVDRDRVREAELQVEAARTGGGGAVADADDLELLGEALGHAGDHVGDQRPGETVQRTVLALVVGTGRRGARRPHARS